MVGRGRRVAAVLAFSPCTRTVVDSAEPVSLSGAGGGGAGNAEINTLSTFAGETCPGCDWAPNDGAGSGERLGGLARRVATLGPSGRDRNGLRDSVAAAGAVDSCGNDGVGQLKSRLVMPGALVGVSRARGRQALVGVLLLYTVATAALTDAG